jgi:hypothetical protein
MHCRATQCKQASQIAICTIFGKGSSTYPAPIIFFMGKHCRCMASYTNMGQSAITLIPRRESKFPKVEFLVSTHSACPCSMFPSAPQPTGNYLYFASNKQAEKIIQNLNHHIVELNCHKCKQTASTAILSEFLNNAHQDSKHCKCMASLYKHQSAITLILRRESKFFQLVSTHSGCPCKNYVRVPTPPGINFFSFFYLVQASRPTKQKILVQKPPHS